MINSDRKTLKELINKNLTSPTIFIVPLIIIIATFLYFSTVNNFYNFLADELVRNKNESNKHILTKDGENMSLQFGEAEASLNFLQTQHLQFFRNVDLLAKSIDPDLPLEDFTEKDILFNGTMKGLYPEFIIKDDKVLLKETPIGSNLVYFLDEKNNSKKYMIATLGERYDSFYKRIVDNNKLVSQIFFYTEDGMIKVYPYIDDYYEKYKLNGNRSGLNMDFKELKNAKWTKPYFNPITREYIVSYVVPLISNKQYLGVNGASVSIEQIKSLFLNEHDRNMFLLDENNEMLIMGNGAENFFKEFDEFKVQINGHLEKAIKEKQTISRLSIYEKAFLFTIVDVPRLNWKLVNITDENILLQATRAQKKNFSRIGVIAITWIIILYVIFLIHLIYKASKLAELISGPVKRLSYHTKNFSKHVSESDFIYSNIVEIDNLNRNFLQLAEELDERTNELIKAEIQKKEKEREAEKYYLNSITDSLTNLYNRVKIEEVLEYEMGQAIITKNPLSLIFIDIDDFKKVNDSMGHEKGDKVLGRFSRILSSNIKETDYVGRWGGEEFIIICTNTALQDAAEFAELLRKAIEGYNFKTGEIQTASFGVAQLNGDDTIRDIITKADNAMYEAKNSSKNVVMIYNEE